jgi:formate-dependent nitrite reductase membrane component NrfD
LIAFGLVAATSFLGPFLGMPVDVWYILGPGLVLALLAAAYSGFLFGQAEGRDFWQSPLLPVHLFAQAVMAGAATMLLIGLVVGPQPAVNAALAGALAVGVVAHLALVAAEIAMPHANTHIRRAVDTLVGGSLRNRFWGGAVLFGMVAPLAALGLAAIAPPIAGGLEAFAASLALAGLLVYEDLWITAGQSVPMS